jgi:hypothetical protein
MPPELADPFRDAVALTRCWMDGDEEGVAVIFAALADEPRALEAVTRTVVALFGSLLRDCGARPEWITSFQQRNDL